MIPDLPLTGIRVIDVSMWFAGPMCTRLLGDLGAQVIKIESIKHIDPWRGGVDAERARLLFTFRPPTDRPWDCNPGFNLQNRNKLGVTLDLNTEEGKDIFKRLIKISDVLVENYSPRVMPKLGLDYPVLKEIKPELIMMSLPALGSTGPDRDFLAFGQTIDCMSGMAYLTGYMGEEPMLQSGLSYGDPLSGMNAAFAVVAALNHRRRTGEGMYCELSQVEGLVAFNADSVMDYTMNGRIRERIGNRHRSMAPHGCYRCKGEDQWLAISAPTDDEWRRLCQAMASPAWIKETRFADSVSRYDNQDEMDKLIEAWTLTQEKCAAMRLLQEYGVPAGPVHDAKEMLEDEHFNARGIFEAALHPIAGAKTEIAAFARFSRTPIHIRTAAPCFGEHNECVFGQMLGMGQEEIRNLEEKGVTGKWPAAKQQGSM
jgi:crotonobetainyl-CoA:carnitine CoA-transferase CaiB-like acyl-CoA transferase